MKGSSDMDNIETSNIESEAKKGKHPREEAKDMYNLTINQRLFADNYLICLDNYTAMEKAGLIRDDWNKATTVKNAQNLKRNPDVKKYISWKLEQLHMENRDVLKADEILTFLTKIVRGQHTDENYVILRTGGVKEVGGFEDKLRKTLQRVKTTEQLKACELFMKYFPQIESEKKLVTILDDIIPSEELD